jgi:flagellar biosynthetic protein FliR
VPSLLSAVADALARRGVDLASLGLAWARATPAVVVVPAFGLRVFPPPARAVLALALGATVFPALAPIRVPEGASWPVELLVQMALGLPVAIAAAVPLWAATMAGGVVDALRGASTQSAATAPTVESGATPLGIPLSVLASGIFLTTGGPARVASALATASFAGHPILSAAVDLTRGIELAVAIAGPLLAASVVVEVAGALVARAAAPAQLHLLLAPLRALALLIVLGLSFERLAIVMGAAVEHAPLHL